jgi:hypothetical protein
MSAFTDPRAGEPGDRAIMTTGSTTRSGHAVGISRTLHQAGAKARDPGYLPPRCPPCQKPPIATRDAWSSRRVRDSAAAPQSPRLLSTLTNESFRALVSAMEHAGRGRDRGSGGGRMTAEP